MKGMIQIQEFNTTTMKYEIIAKFETLEQAENYAEEHDLTDCRFIFSIEVGRTQGSMERFWDETLADIRSGKISDEAFQSIAASLKPKGWR